jgi:hypothetical protein
MKELVMRPSFARTWGLVAALVACGGAQVDEGTSPETQGKARGAIAAKVNGDAIGTEEVQALAAAANLTPEAALKRLIEERLLAQYAEARGYGSWEVVRTETARARVRALLEEAVEKSVGPESISNKQIAERFENVRKRLPQDAKLEEWESRLREQLVLEARQKRVEQLVKELRARTEVVYDEKAIQEAFPKEAALGSGT